MTNATRHTRPGSTVRSTPVKVVSRTDAGVAVVAAAAPGRSPVGPVTNATWAWSVRRFARALMWTLPGYAVAYGAVTLGRWDGGAPLPYLENGRAIHLVGWVVAVWLGLMALIAMAGLLAAARSRRTATTGLMVGLAGAVLWLPFAALARDTPVYGTDARTLALAGAAVYSAGWLLAGWSVLASGLFSRSDGLLLMVAAPMLGVAGLLLGPLQTVGAIFTLAAGIGMSWTAGRFVPSVRAAPETRASATAAGAQAVAAQVATTGGVN
ncbi:hypothetical protein [Phytohabitans suffuscus]|uniref:Uncharacterized protein n=1 Tax=Phytohabitans suffuscus TaxID=624315 RepID=A0A6F8YBJ8_9ACTN|nr:hypothetical protein [Phytohabitans suffuscus]BCB83358.1 hypothetical protein Psuf_006710 [Phytohabitans suffuscus]